MIDPIVHIDSMHTDNRERDMQRVTVTFYGTKAEADMVARDLKLYLNNLERVHGMNI